LRSRSTCRYTERHPKEKAFWQEVDKYFDKIPIDLSCLPDEYSPAGFHFYRMTKKQMYISLA
jgi:hypothetical protein